MKTLLKIQSSRLAALPHYLPESNTLTSRRAQEIALSFGDDLAFLEPEFAQANQYSQDRMTRADTRGEGLGKYHNAERLFFGYVYEMHRCAACESAEAMRHE